MVWFMNHNLTDNRTTVGSYDNRSSSGVFLMPKERYMREGAPIQPHANAPLRAKPRGRFAHWLLSSRDIPRECIRLADSPCAQPRSRDGQ